jgi:phage/plasmid-like protein (TIGR03299 family)
MSHEIDMSNNKANTAYVGDEPWHGLGKRLTPDADIDTWKREAGMVWVVKEGKVLYVRDAKDAAGNEVGEVADFPGRKALYRSDTLAPLSIVTDKFNVVQPGDVMEFFRKMVEEHGFKMETAGCLRGGKKIWALARIAEAFKVLDDVVQPYALLSTAYDATMATWARLCTTRVVCANTIAIAETEQGKIVRVPHNATFDPDAVRLQLGLALSSWERFKVRALKMSEHVVTDPEAEAFLRELLGVDEGETPRGFARIVQLFKGAQMGHDKKSTRQTLWGVVQAVAEHVDHNPYSHSDDTRLDSAWFGGGNNIKIAAFKKALEMVEPANDDKVTVAA